MTKKQQNEFKEQCKIFVWREANKIKYPCLKFLYGSMNGVKLDIVTATKAKANGMTKGFPDIFLPYPNKTYAGLFIELKTETGRVSKEQREFIDYLNIAGYRAVVCHGHKSAIKNILEYLSTTLK